MMGHKTKTAGDLIKLLKDLDPDTELWIQYVRDNNECVPIKGLPDIKTIAHGYRHYYDGTKKEMWLVHSKNRPAFDVEDNEDEILETKTAVVWNI